MRAVGRRYVRRAFSAGAVAGALLLGATGCGAGETVRVADGMAPEPPAVSSPARIDRAAFARFSSADRLTCGGPRSHGTLDYALVLGPDGKPVYSKNAETPQKIAQRWADREMERRPQSWSVPEPPTARFTYDRAPAKARRVVIDFVTSSGAVMTSLFASRDEGSGWRLHEATACAYNPDYAADPEGEFVDLARGPGA